MSLESSIDSLARAIELLAATLAAGKVNSYDGAIELGTVPQDMQYVPPADQARARHATVLENAAAAARDRPRAPAADAPRKTAVNLPATEDPIERTQDLPPVTKDRKPDPAVERTNQPPAAAQSADATQKPRRGRPPKSRAQQEEIDRIDSEPAREAHAASVTPRAVERTVEEGEARGPAESISKDPEKLEHLSKLVMKAGSIDWDRTCGVLDNHGIEGVSQATLDQYESLVAGLKKITTAAQRAA